MIRQLRNLHGQKLHATDGEIGRVTDFYFDDHSWVMRYFVVELGNWITRHEVLIAPEAVREKESNELTVNLSRDQVKNSPDIDTARPVSRSHEEALRQYYGWPLYWGGAAVIGAEPAGAPAAQVREDEAPEHAGPRLRSVHELTGYSIHARDGSFGHIDDFLADDDGWKIRYLVINTRAWKPSKRVLISPEWIQEVRWSASDVMVKLNRATIEKAPEYEHGKPLSRDYEHELHEYYSQPKYWE
jgi:uncharacterized protein YrrD